MKKSRYTVRMRTAARREGTGYTIERGQEAITEIVVQGRRPVCDLHWARRHHVCKGGRQE